MQWLVGKRFHMEINADSCSGTVILCVLLRYSIYWIHSRISDYRGLEKVILHNQISAVVRCNSVALKTNNANVRCLSYNTLFFHLLLPEKEMLSTYNTQAQGQYNICYCIQGYKIISVKALMYYCIILY